MALKTNKIDKDSASFLRANEHRSDGGTFEYEAVVLSDASERRFVYHITAVKTGAMVEAMKSYSGAEGFIPHLIIEVLHAEPIQILDPD